MRFNPDVTGRKYVNGHSALPEDPSHFSERRFQILDVLQSRRGEDKVERFVVIRNAIVDWVYPVIRVVDCSTSQRVSKELPVFRLTKDNGRSNVKSIRIVPRVAVFVNEIALSTAEIEDARLGGQVQVQISKHPPMLTDHAPDVEIAGGLFHEDVTF